jgi:hypothetical protein
MKKILVLFLGLLMFTGCASPEEKAEKKDLETLESVGFTAENAQAFYDFSNSSKIIFNEMDNINNDFVRNSEKILDKDYNKVAAAAEVSKDAYKKLNPDDADEYFRYLSNDVASSPLLLLEKMKNTGEKLTNMNAALILNEMVPFAQKAIEANNISGSKKEKALEWYHKNNEYVGIFKYVHEYKAK